MYMAKIPNITKGFGRQGEEAHVASNSYMAIFPNGNSITLIKNDPMTLTEQQAKDTIRKILNGNPQRVLDISNEKTLIFDPSSAPAVEVPKPETPANILSTSTESGAAKTAQAEQTVNNRKASRTRHKLREVDDGVRGIWNQERELAWVRKVLPQLSEDNRIRVVKGLIRVGSQGTLAWGQFNNGIVTLSDIAAEGTVYHEAFHVVFNLLLDQTERQGLLAEAREMYGDKSELDLEEDMAEGFREYMQTRQAEGLFNRIKNFFRDLYVKVTNWNRIQPHLIAYYQMINEGKYAGDKLDISLINQSRNRIVSPEELEKTLNDEFKKANEEVRKLNYKTYYTVDAAMRAFRNSNIREAFLYRITREGANNAVGHKIQLLTVPMFNRYKERELNRLRKSTGIELLFDSLDSDIQMQLLNKGWTKEQFDSISIAERDQAIACLTI